MFTPVKKRIPWFNGKITIILPNSSLPYTMIIKNCPIMYNVNVNSTCNMKDKIISVGPFSKVDNIYFYKFVIFFPKDLNIKKELTMFLDTVKCNIITGYQIELTDELISTVATSCLHAWRLSIKETNITITDGNIKDKLSVILKFTFDTWFSN